MLGYKFEENLSVFFTVFYFRSGAPKLDSANLEFDNSNFNPGFDLSKFSSGNPNNRGIFMERLPAFSWCPDWTSEPVKKMKIK